jgi:hypothetical protein
MARGLDAVAHSAAIEAGIPTIGVLGNGFGVVYPAANRALYERMIAQGCLITELPPGERPHAAPSTSQSLDQRTCRRHRGRRSRARLRRIDHR